MQQHCATQVAWKAGEQAAENREQLTSEVTVGRNLGDVPLPKVLFYPIINIGRRNRKGRLDQE